MTQELQRPAPAAAGSEPLGADRAGELIVPTLTPDANKRQVIRAEIIGSDRCTAEELTATSTTPVIALCRKLIEAGVDQDRPLLAYRGATLCLRVSSIEAGAAVVINGKGTGFERPGAVGIAAPVRFPAAVAP
jgi:hypothetical protein